MEVIQGRGESRKNWTAAKRKSDKRRWRRCPCSKNDPGLNQFVPVRAQELTADELVHLTDYHLITQKPVLFVCNISENDIASGGNATARLSLSTRESWRGAVRFPERSGRAGVAACERKSYMDILSMREGGLDRWCTPATTWGWPMFTTGEIEVRVADSEEHKAPRARCDPRISRRASSARRCELRRFRRNKGEKGCCIMGNYGRKGRNM
jgi:ribosome-binding ATPase YchF (GTP1/OBG family)